MQVMDQCGCSVVEEQTTEQDLQKAVAAAVEGMVKSLRHSGRAYAKGMLEAGMFARQALVGKLKLGVERAAAVEEIEKHLAGVGDGKPDVCRLIRCYEAYRLLAVEPGVDAETVAIRCYKDAWSLLVERAARGAADEHHVLLPGVEQEARELFVFAVQNNLDRDACVQKCRELKAKAKGRAVKQRTPKRTDTPPAGVNLIPAKGTPKDMGDFLARCIVASIDPDLCLVEMLGCLINATTKAPVAAFKSDVIQDLLLSCVWKIQDAAESQEGQDRRDYFRRR